MFFTLGRQHAISRKAVKNVVARRLCECCLLSKASAVRLVEPFADTWKARWPTALLSAWDNSRIELKLFIFTSWIVSELLIGVRLFDYVALGSKTVTFFFEAASFVATNGNLYVDGLVGWIPIDALNFDEGKLGSCICDCVYITDSLLLWLFRQLRFQLRLVSIRVTLRSTEPVGLQRLIFTIKFISSGAIV